MERDKEIEEKRAIKKEEQAGLVPPGIF
jgi:hypothetical protein